MVTNHLQVNDSDSRPVREFKQATATDIRRRFNLEQEDGLITRACLLDPRFKHRFKDRAGAVNEIIEDMTKQHHHDHSNQDHAAAEPPPKKTATETALDYLIPSSSDEDDTEDASDIVKREWDSYMQLRKVAKNKDPTLWWRKNYVYYPNLAKQAREILGIPATSVPSERAFSTAGNIVNHKRSRLTTEHVNMLVFLSKNLQD